ncbi:MAG TPA: 3-isopropylmalate dehydratase large subunit [Stellaceae bacterium]|nr:3-isopropylmalate dehydratase large subunit [Stellaceae bacterium]
MINSAPPRRRPRTLFDKIWQRHVVSDFGDGLCLLYIDRILLHERGGGMALAALSRAGRRVRRPETVFATFDHVLDTRPGRTGAALASGGAEFIDALRRGSAFHGVELFDIADERQGIVHVISPEQAIVLPGTTVVCNDSHTCTLGGVSTLGLGIGTSDIEHVLATQTLVTHRPKTMRLRLEGRLPASLTAKDLVLHVIGTIGAAGANGYAVEMAGAIVRDMTVEERLTVCNMAVEFAARSAVISPDEKTFRYLAGGTFAPKRALWERAVAAWRELASDADAVFDAETVVDCGDLEPQVTWGTSPEHTLPIGGAVPRPEECRDPARARRSLEYMELTPGMPIAGLPVDGAFIGSCTNGRLSDLRTAAEILKDRRVAPTVRALCVPGSTRVKRMAEAEGLDRIFVNAGFEWRESGCSLCFSGGENFEPGRRVITTTNRNFENRQGRFVRSHLASPKTVAASAIAGHIVGADMLGNRAR